MFIINKISSLSTRSKEVLYRIIYNLLAVILFLLLLLSILKTDKLSYIHISPTTNNLLQTEDTIAVFNSNSNTPIPNTELNNYLNDIFCIRNKSILNGYVENLYQFYDKDNKNSLLSLNYEFKRISYIRDWAIQRNIILTSITSTIDINDIKHNGDITTLKVNESCNFNYIYTNNKLTNTFQVNLSHAITLKCYNNTYIIDKDYYLDFLGDELNKYKFNFSETTLPYNKSVDTSFNIPSTFNVGDIVSYYKYNFIDHKAFISGFDSNGYPLINSTTISCSNLPYDIGWKVKNIKVN